VGRLRPAIIAAMWTLMPLALAACGTTTADRTSSGAGIGAGTGAAIGAIFGGIGAIPGALIGAAAGGGTGAVTTPTQVDLGTPVSAKQ
jgi:osmotically inducible lipoprotein OsmB